MKIIKTAGAFIVVASLSASACAAKRATANQNEGEEKLFSSYSGEEYEKEMQTAEGEQTNDQGGSVSPGVLQNITDTLENLYARVFSRCLLKDMEEFDNRWIAGTFTVEVTIMTDGKIKKGDGIPEIHLERNPDILAGLSKVAPQAVRVGFAAETGDPEREARGQLERKDAHWIVANDVSRGDIGFNHDDNEVTVYRREGPPVFLSRRPKDEVAEALVELLAERLGPRPAPGDEVSDREPRSVGR